jgi:beta-galactosidase/beta-glucuronidase
MVWNDFWESTQGYNLEAQDPALFLKNARDSILHFRHHPSIVVWCGRNEGVPQPIINEGWPRSDAHARPHALLHRQLEPGEPAQLRALSVSAA